MHKVQTIIRKARGESSQLEFAVRLGKTQGLISKYERGLVSPPAETLDQCMDILQMNTQDDISAEALAMKIKKKLQSPDSSEIRHAISVLVDSANPCNVVDLP